MKQITLIIVLLIGIIFKASAQVSYPSVEKGLTFKSKDEKVKMGFSFRVQSLASYQNDMDGNNEDMRAMVRRMRLKSKGYIYSPKFEYKLELALSNRDQGNSKDASQVSNGSKMVLDAVLKANDGDSTPYGLDKLSCLEIENVLFLLEIYNR